MWELVAYRKDAGKPPVVIGAFDAYEDAMAEMEAVRATGLVSETFFYTGTSRVFSVTRPLSEFRQLVVVQR